MLLHLDWQERKLGILSFCEPSGGDNSCGVDVSAVNDVEISVINIGGDVSNADSFAYLVNGVNSRKDNEYSSFDEADNEIDGDVRDEICDQPTPSPTSSPTPMPSNNPTPNPTDNPTREQTQAATPPPTSRPTDIRTKSYTSNNR